MANTFSNKKIVLDTFASAIDVRAALNQVKQNRLSLISIKWQGPTTIGHTCTITNDEGEEVFAEACVIADETKIEYYFGSEESNLKIAASGVTSGKVIIRLREDRTI